MMREEDVHEVLEALEAHLISVVIDGGWGVDALIGKRTRSHSDLDLVIEGDQTEMAHAVLAKLGFFHDENAKPGLPARFVLRDEQGRQVDLHMIRFDNEGNGWQELGAGSRTLYPSEELKAVGRIAGRPVPCISADLQLRHHLGHPRSATVLHNLELLRRLEDAIPPDSGPTSDAPQNESL
jgi:lincosamide nucleotidyltransferase A/C/D/E